MSEAAKTTTFVGAAVVVLLLALVTRPQQPTAGAAVDGKKILNEVDDPLSASRLEIIKYDEDTSSIKQFEVAQVDGVWSIPSHQDYPADAEQQMAAAATSVMNLKVLGVVTTNPAEHATYGVVDPDVDKLKPGAVGVGMRVTMENSAGDRLVNIIIGKKVKDQEGQRYVREVGRDPVYLVKLDASKLTTRFEDWIEEDLLKLNPFDIRQVTLNDYSVELGLGGGGLTVLWDRRSEMTFAYDDTDAKWTAKELKVFDSQARQFHTVTLADDEEVNNDKLNELKNALDDLKIVDVERKPEGLSRDLKAEKDFATKEEAVRNLAARGFMPVQISQDAYEILSSEGEVLCQMKNGVEYVLRFGKLVMGSSGDSGGDADKKEDGTKDGDASNDDEDSGIHRYLFVTVRFNEDVIPRPELEELPELPEGAKEAADEKKAEDGEKADAGEKPEGAEKDTSSDAGAEKQAEAKADDAATKEEDAEAGGDKEAKDGEKQEDADAEKKEEDQPQDDALAELIKKRKEIEKENQRKLDDYQEKIKKAKDRVKELNDRFGDWYYVISDSVFKKIHLGRDDVIKKKEKKEAKDEENKDDTTSGPIRQLDDLQRSVDTAAGEKAAEEKAADKEAGDKEADGKETAANEADDKKAADQGADKKGADNASADGAAEKEATGGAAPEGEPPAEGAESAGEKPAAAPSE